MEKFYSPEFYGYVVDTVGDGRQVSAVRNVIQGALQRAAVKREVYRFPSDDPLGNWFIYGTYRAAGLSARSLLEVDKEADHKVRFYLGGSLVETQRVKAAPLPRGYAHDEEKKSTGTRGRISSYSKGSQRRLQRRLAKFNNKALAEGLFITLTYPSEYPHPAEAKQQLRAFIKRLRRAFKDICVIWRLEFQKRGAPHFHLLVLGASYIPHQWTAQAWYEVVGSENPDHLKAGTEVRRVKNARHANWYISKYMAKGDQAPSGFEGVGRFWGIEGAKERYEATFIDVTLNGYEVIELGRFMRQLKKSKQPNKPTFNRYQDHVIGRKRSYFCNAEQVFDRLTQIVRPRYA